MTKPRVNVLCLGNMYKYLKQGLTEALGHVREYANKEDKVRARPSLALPKGSKVKTKKPLSYTDLVSKLGFSLLTALDL